jgi:hypothetical protein
MLSGEVFKVAAGSCINVGRNFVPAEGSFQGMQLEIISGFAGFPKNCIYLVLAKKAIYILLISVYLQGEIGYINYLGIRRLETLRIDRI